MQALFIAFVKELGRSAGAALSIAAIPRCPSCAPVLHCAELPSLPSCVCNADGHRAVPACPASHSFQTFVEGLITGIICSVLFAISFALFRRRLAISREPTALLAAPAATVDVIPDIQSAARAQLALVRGRKP